VYNPPKLALIRSADVFVMNYKLNYILDNCLFVYYSSIDIGLLLSSSTLYHHHHFDMSILNMYTIVIR